MKTPWSFDEDEVPDDIRSVDTASGGSRKWLVLGLLCWGLLIVGVAMVYMAGISIPGTPQAAQTQTPDVGLTVTSEQVQLILPIGGQQFGATVQFKPSVRAELIIADQRIPIGQSG